VRYFIEISYNGKNFHGWQIQDNAETIQSRLEDSLSKILNKKITVFGSGRTDTGVHAISQVAHFDYDDVLNPNFLYRMNAILPIDISINKVTKVRDNANSRFDATLREYIYMIHTQKSPFLDGLSLFYKYKINLKLINEAASILFKYSDFKSFSKVGTDVNNYNCKIKTAEIKKNKDHFIFTISANRFLRGMVRAIFGTLLEINENKKSLDDFKKIIEGKDRSLAGPSLPPHGLYLKEVKYNSDIYI
tara:strand:- start:875 stop:1615 length:741 start_codon:yes stop_codon:yes gene_type:complete